VCISWIIKCPISLMHGVTMKIKLVFNFMFLAQCIVNIIIKYKPTKFTFSKSIF